MSAEKDWLNSLATASDLVGQTISRLVEIQNDPSTSEAELRLIEVELPGLRLRREELDAEFAAVVAKMGAAQPPGKKSLDELVQTTRTLSDRIEKAARANVLLQAVASVIGAAKAAAG